MSKRKSRVWIAKQFTPKVQKFLWSKAHRTAKWFGREPAEAFAEASALFVEACQKWDPERGPVENWVNFFVSRELIEIQRCSARRNRIAPRETEPVDFDAVPTEDPLPFIREEVTSKLDEDAKLVVNLVLETPKEMLKMLRTRRKHLTRSEPEEIGVRTVLRSYLQDLGWGLNRIRSTFAQITSALA